MNRLSIVGIAISGIGGLIALTPMYYFFVMHGLYNYDPDVMPIAVLGLPLILLGFIIFAGTSIVELWRDN